MPAQSNLKYIKQGIRRLTRSPGTNNLSENYLETSINNFMAFHLPDRIKFKDLRSTFTFYTTPFVDTYETITDPAQATNPFYLFKDRYVNVYQPVYFAGVQGSFFLDRGLFYSYWPQTNLISNTQLTGDGITTTFSGITPAHPMLRNNVQFSTVDANNNALVLVDYPSAADPYIGFLGPVNTPQTTAIPYGFVNYVTGAFTLTMPGIPAAAAIIWLDNITYQPGIPTTMMWFDNILTIRPVPDKTYTVQLTVDKMPIELLDDMDEPTIHQWAEYIMTGTALNIFRDRMDLTSYGQLRPIFDELEMMAQRSTLCEAVDSPTYSYYKQKRRRYGWWPFGSLPF